MERVRRIRARREFAAQIASEFMLENRRLLAITFQKAYSMDFRYYDSSSINGLQPGQRVRFSNIILKDGPATPPGHADYGWIVWETSKQSGELHPNAIPKIVEASSSSISLKAMWDGNYDNDILLSVNVEIENLGNLYVDYPKIEDNGLISYRYGVSGADIDWRDKYVGTDLVLANDNFDVIKQLHHSYLDGKATGEWKKPSFFVPISQIGEIPINATKLVTRIDSDKVIPEPIENDNTRFREIPIRNIEVKQPVVNSDASITFGYKKSSLLFRANDQGGIIRLYYADGPNDEDIRQFIDELEISPSSSESFKTVAYNSDPTRPLTKRPVWATHIIARLESASDPLSDSNADDNRQSLRLVQIYVNKFEWSDKGVPVISITQNGVWPSGIKPVINIYWWNSYFDKDLDQFNPVWTIQIRQNVSQYFVRLPRSVIRSKEDWSDTMVATISFGNLFEYRDKARIKSLIGGYTPTIRQPRSGQTANINTWGGSQDPLNIWTLRSFISDNDGLHLRNIKMGNRYVAKEMSLPYFEIITERLGKKRGELIPNGTNSQVRSRLVEYQKPVIVDEDGKPGITDLDPLVIRAKYIVDRLGTNSSNYLEITQEYKFYQANPNKDETPKIFQWLAFGPSGPKAWFYPTVSYKYHSFDGDSLVAISLPQRLDFQLENSRRNTLAIAQDPDIPVPSDLLRGGLRLFRDENPLQKESRVVAIANGKKGVMDNVHITFKELVDLPINFDREDNPVWNPLDWILSGYSLPYAAGFASRIFTHMLPPGSMEAIHIHWRWSWFLEQAGSPLSDNKAGEPKIPDGSNQSVEVGFVRRRRNEYDPTNWRNLVGNENVASKDFVMWYDGIGFQKEDTFFQHGGFVERMVPMTGQTTMPLTIDAPEPEMPYEEMVEINLTGESSISSKIVSEDEDADQATLSMEVSKSPRFGKVTRENDNFQYTPNSDLKSNNDSFTLNISDDEGTFKIIKVTVRTKPDVPSNLRMANIWSRTVDINFNDNSTNETRFVAEISEDQGQTWRFASSSIPDWKAIRIEELQPNTSYLVRVRAENGSNYSDYSEPIMFVTRDTSVLAPLNLRAANIWTTAVDINWDDASDNEGNFRIAMSKDEGQSWTNIGIADRNSIRFRVEDLTPGTKYKFKVRAATEGSYSDYSNILELITKDILPEKPSDLIIENIWSSKIDLKWKDNSSNEDGFHVEMSRNSGETWEKISTLYRDSLGFRTMDLEQNTDYQFRVVAYNSAGVSPPSQTVKAKTLKSIPLAPTGLVYDYIGSRSVSIRWNDNSSNEEEYVIQLSQDNEKSWKNVKYTSSNISSTNLDNLVPATSYLIRIVAVNNGGVSEPSNVISVNTKADLPANPSQLRVTYHWLRGLNLVWIDNSDNETGFNVYVSYNGIDFFKLATVRKNIRSYKINHNQVRAIPHWFKITSTNDFGESEASNTYFWDEISG